MKPTMMFAVIMATAIVLMSAFNIDFAPTTTIELSESVQAGALYVCPANSSLWDGFARGMQILKKPLTIGFFFALTLLIFIWLWALYQNLLKDKFIRDAYKTPWAYTKMLFWATVIVCLVMFTPNHFRTVKVDGTNTNWVLCESNTLGAKAAPATSVHK